MILDSRTSRRYSAQEMLEIWAQTQLANGPGSLAFPRGYERDFTRGRRETEPSIAAYVVWTPGYEAYKPHLVSRLVRGSRARAAKVMTKRFERRLAVRLLKQPWMPPALRETLCAWDLAGLAAGKADSKTRGSSAPTKC